MSLNKKVSLYVLPMGQMSLWGTINWPCPTRVYEYSIVNYLIVPLIKLRSHSRIGPHNYDILSIIYGSLLGDGYAEKHGNGTRISFYQEHSHKDYLLWLHNYFSKKGYCNSKLPKIQTRLAANGKIRYIIRFKTYTYTSFNWINNIWYINGKKVIPHNIEEYLSPLALAVWIMDDGGKVSSGLKLCANSFTLSEIEKLCDILNKKYNLMASPNKAGDLNKDQYVIYISKYSINQLAKLVLPYMHNSMKYKLN